MDDAAFEHYLKERYYDQIDWYDRKSLWNQCWFKRLQWSLIILSALTPILIAVKAMSEQLPWLIWIPLVTSTLVAIITGALKSFNFQENWTSYRTICETLRKEVHYYNALIGEYKTANDPRSTFVKRVENVISKENTLWLDGQNSDNNNQQNTASDKK